MWYEFRIEDNLSGMFGAKTPELCASGDTCGTNGYKLVANAAFSQYEGY